MPANHPQDLPQVWFEVGESEFAVLPAPVLDQGTTKQNSQPLTATQRLLDSRERVHSLLDGIPPIQHPMVRTSYPPPPSNQKASADERPLSRDLEPFSRSFTPPLGRAVSEQQSPELCLALSDKIRTHRDCIQHAYAFRHKENI